MGIIREEIALVADAVDELEAGLTEDITDIRGEISVLQAANDDLKKQVKELRENCQYNRSFHHCCHSHPPQVTYYMQPQPYYGGAFGYNTTYQVSSGSYST